MRDDNALGARRGGGSGCGRRGWGEGHGEGEGVRESPWLPGVWERVEGTSSQREDIARERGRRE